MQNKLQGQFTFVNAGKQKGFEMPCNKGKECSCKIQHRQYCIHWTPSKGSKYSRCIRFLNSRITCSLKQAACNTCEFFIRELPKRNAEIDWSNKDEVREHRRKYMKKYRKKKRFEKEKKAKEQFKRETGQPIKEKSKRSNKKGGQAC